jgi:hypothetical protein
LSRKKDSGLPEPKDGASALCLPRTDSAPDPCRQGAGALGYALHVDVENGRYVERQHLHRPAVARRHDDAAELVAVRQIRLRLQRERLLLCS